MRKLVIVGCGMAAARLLQELVKRLAPYTIEVIGEETSPGYNRILLSSLLAGEHSEADLTLLERAWYNAHGITLHTGERVCAVDTVQRTVTTSRGRRSKYDLLVFATGSLPNWPSIPGLDTGGVLGFRTQQDLQQIHELAAGGSKALVLGGGLLGLEAASGISGLGLDVTVMHRQDWLMNRQLDPTAAGVLQASLERRGIGFRLGAIPAQIHSTNSMVSGVTLDSGEYLPCSLLLLAIGIAPNVTVAQAAGVPCDKGILVDAQLRTEIAGVYALGECCQLGEHLFGLVAPVYEQAAVLAAQLAGDEAVYYKPRESPVQLKIAGIQVEAAGSQEAGIDDESQVLSDPDQGIYRRLIFSKGRLSGYLLVGNKSSATWYRELLLQGSDVSLLRPSMMFGAPQRSPQYPVQELHHASH